MFELSEEGRHGEALELLQTVTAENEDQSVRLSYNRACLLALKGDRNAAIVELEDAMADPLVWFSPEMLGTDPDLGSLQGDRRFEEVMHTGEKRRDEAQKTTRPESLIVRPRSGGRPPRGTIAILHGNHSNTADVRPHWEPLCDEGWTLLFVQSSRVGFHTYVRSWEDYGRARIDVAEAVNALSDEERANLVLGGFSLGARTAIRLGLDGTIAVSAIVAHEPAPAEGFSAWLRSISPHPIPIYLTIGEADSYQKDSEAIASALGLVDTAVRLPAVGHGFPPGFAALVQGMLAGVAE